jgi:type IV pilus assembly protein PilN
MKAGINLASQPFRRNRPVIVAAYLLSAALVLLLGLQISLIWMERSQLTETRQTIDTLEQSLRSVSKQQATLAAVQRKPENAQVLERSAFLNSLIYRKVISWTKIFSNLEVTLPHNVRVISIRPYLTQNNEVILEMNVGAEQTDPVLQLLVRLETSPAFGTTSVANRQPPSQADPLYRYRVNVSYAQKF